jgi:hypothetical protein
MALIVPGPASAELFNNLKLSGQLDWQHLSGRNIADFQTSPDTCTTCTGTLAGRPSNGNDRLSGSLTRVLLNLEWDVLDDVHSQVTIRKNDRAWSGPGGNAGDQGGGAGVAGGQPLQGGAGIGVVDQTYVQRVNIKIDKMFGHFDMTMGRQYYGEPGDLIMYFGPVDTYGLWVTSLDAFRLDTENDWMTFTGLAGTTARASASLAALPDNNTHIRGFDIGWKNLPLKVNTFIWNRLTQATGGLGQAAQITDGTGTTLNGINDNLYVYGVKLRGEAAGGWLSVDLAANGGRDSLSGPANATAAGDGCPQEGCYAGTASYTGYGALLDVGYNAEVANVGGFTPWGTFGYGSGRASNQENTNETFTTPMSDFRPGVINRRFPGTLSSVALGSAYTNASNGATGVGTRGLGNRVVWGLGLNYTPAFEDRMTWGLSFWDFRFQRSTDLLAGKNAEPANSGNKHIGSEFGITSEWRHSENVTMGLGWATFQPGGFIKEEMEDTPLVPINLGSGSSPAQLWFADLTVKF